MFILVLSQENTQILSGARDVKSNISYFTRHINIAYDIKFHVPERFQYNLPNKRSKLQ